MHQSLAALLYCFVFSSHSFISIGNLVVGEIIKMNVDLDSVPSSVSEALKMFIEALTDEEKKALKEIEEDQIAIFHHTWGDEIRNQWSMFEKDTLLVNSFKVVGITHADDMSGIILKSAHRQLNKKPIKLAEQIKQYQDYWMKEIGKKMP